ncbi:unnamed protein product [Leptosia nina]|uniref:Protein real-time n=1 Tax=Leptosia nina TaxID=320188 RepID=A0AAV1JRW1_9NEOP
MFACRAMNNVCSLLGPSRRRSSVGLARSSHKLFRGRSKSLPKDHSSEKKSSHTFKLLSRSKSKPKLLDQSTSTTSFNKKREEKKCLDSLEERVKRVAVASPELRPEAVNVAPDLCQNSPCVCASTEAVDEMSRWDSLVIVLVFALIVGYQYTLDSEYIKRNLGELSPIQESRLLQLRKWIADLQKGKVPSDTTLLRFLRARDFNVEKAREMLSQSLLWRKKHQVDKILSEYETPDVVTQYFPGGWHHHDKDGRPLYVLRLGQMDVKGLLKSIGEDGLLKLTLHVCEEGLKLLEEATRSSEHAILSWCLLVDLDGLNMRHLWRPGVRALLRIIQIVEANYPETMGRVLIVRAPRVFPILWTIVSTFIDENTRSKFLFYGGKDYLQAGGLLDYIPKDIIPDFLGGPCKSFVHEGGLVPKSLYVSGAFTEREGDPLSEDSIYRSVSLAKGQVHEVIVVNRDPQSVLTWDFDVLRHDISFTVFRTDREIDQSDQTDHAAAVCVGGAAAEEGRSVLEERGWREGEHYQRVEPALICHDGESIQGSHVMSECGSYVLQWRCELLDTSHRAAQLMYFHETLASQHYKGSMSSLQSATSGFSCLSNKSGSSCPSR